MLKWNWKYFGKKWTGLMRVKNFRLAGKYSQWPQIGFWGKWHGNDGSKRHRSASNLMLWSRRVTNDRSKRQFLLRNFVTLYRISGDSFWSWLSNNRFVKCVRTTSSTLNTICSVKIKYFQGSILNKYNFMRGCSETTSPHYRDDTCLVSTEREKGEKCCLEFEKTRISTILLCRYFVDIFIVVFLI